MVKIKFESLINKTLGDNLPNFNATDNRVTDYILTLVLPANRMLQFHTYT